MNSAQASDRRSTGGISDANDNPIGGDTQLSDSSQTGDYESGQASPLDIGQFGTSYTSGQAQDVESPIAGGGYHETEAERALKMQREQTRGRRMQEQLTGVSASIGGGARTAADAPAMNGVEDQAPGEDAGADEAGGEEAAQEQAATEERKAMQVQQERQEATVEGKAKKAKEAIDSIKEAKEKIDRFRNKLKKIKNASESGQLLAAPEDLGLTLMTLVAQMNIQMVNKYMFKFGIIPDQSLPEDYATVCADCCFCSTSFMSPPCCFATFPIIFFIAAGYILKDSIVFQIFSMFF